MNSLCRNFYLIAIRDFAETRRRQEPKVYLCHHITCFSYSPHYIELRIVLVKGGIAFESFGIIFKIFIVSYNILVHTFNINIYLCIEIGIERLCTKFPHRQNILCPLSKEHPNIIHSPT